MIQQWILFLQWHSQMLRQQERGKTIASYYSVKTSQYLPTQTIANIVKM